MLGSVTIYVFTAKPVCGAKAVFGFCETQCLMRLLRVPAQQSTQSSSFMGMNVPTQSPTIHSYKCHTKGSRAPVSQWLWLVAETPWINGSAHLLPHSAEPVRCQVVSMGSNSFPRHCHRTEGPAAPFSRSQAAG